MQEFGAKLFNLFSNGSAQKEPAQEKSVTIDKVSALLSEAETSCTSAQKAKEDRKPYENLCTQASNHYVEALQLLVSIEKQEGEIKSFYANLYVGQGDLHLVLSGRANSNALIYYKKAYEAYVECKPNTVHFKPDLIKKIPKKLQDAYHQRSEYLLEEKQYIEAIACLEEAIAILPKNATLLKDLAKAHYENGNLIEAIKVYHRVENGEANQELNNIKIECITKGETSSGKENYDEAIQFFNLAWDSDSKDQKEAKKGLIKTYTAYGKKFLKEKEYDRAIRKLKTALKYAGENKDTTEASNYVSEHKEATEALVQVYQDYGNEFFNNGHLKEAIEKYQSAAKANNNDKEKEIEPSVAKDIEKKQVDLAIQAGNKSLKVGVRWYWFNDNDARLKALPDARLYFEAVLNFYLEGVKEEDKVVTNMSKRTEMKILLQAAKGLLEANLAEGKILLEKSSKLSDPTMLTQAAERFKDVLRYYPDDIKAKKGLHDVCDTCLKLGRLLLKSSNANNLQKAISGFQTVLNHFPDHIEAKAEFIQASLACAEKLVEQAKNPESNTNSNNILKEALQILNAALEKDKDNSAVKDAISKVDIAPENNVIASEEVVSGLQKTSLPTKPPSVPHAPTSPVAMFGQKPSQTSSSSETAAKSPALLQAVASGVSTSKPL